MATIVLRANKTTPLTNAEVDANFTNLNTDKLDRVSLTAQTVSGSISFNGGLSLGNATSNAVVYGIAGVAAPTLTTRSAGTKLVLYPAVTAATVDYGFGIETSALWSSVPNSAASFKWYGGTTAVASLTGAGVFTTSSIQSTPIGSTTPSTGSFTNLSVNGTVTLTTALPLTQGGTGGTSAAAALVNLGVGSTSNVTFGSIQNTPIGSTTPSTGNFTNLFVNNIRAESIGVGQTWQNVTASRAWSTTYTNLSGRPIVVSAWGSSALINLYITGIVNGGDVTNNTLGNFYGAAPGVTFIVPAGSTYAIISNSTKVAWLELS